MASQWTGDLTLEEKPVQAFCSPEFFHYCSSRVHNMHLFKSKPVWLLQKQCCLEWICSKIISPEATTQSNCTVPYSPLQVHLHPCFDAGEMCQSGLHSCCFLAATSQLCMSCCIFLAFSVYVKSTDHEVVLVIWTTKNPKKWNPVRQERVSGALDFGC